MDITLNIPELFGDMSSKVLYTVTIIDTDDTEDTSARLFLADDTEHLDELVKEYLGVTKDDGEHWDDDWGINIFYYEVGRKI